MGGTALGSQAQVLTTTQFKRLGEHCRKKLANLFDDMRVEYCPRDKELHGDVDLLCAWGGGKADEHVGGSDRSDWAQSEERDRKGLRSLSEQICGSIGGIKWRRTSAMVSVAVPCAVIGVDSDEQGFFQVDVDLLPPPCLDMAMLIMSYRSNIVILPRAVKALSPSLVLLPTCLKLRHTAFPGQPPIEIVLTTSAQELCDWLGLSWDDYGIFDTEADLYRWMTNVPEDSLIAGVWTRVVEGAVMPKKYGGKAHAVRKTEGWDMLARWMREDPTSPYSGLSMAPMIHSGSLTAIDAANDCAVSRPASSNAAIPLDPIARNAVSRWGRQSVVETTTDAMSNAQKPS